MLKKFEKCHFRSHHMPDTCHSNSINLLRLINAKHFIYKFESLIKSETYFVLRLFLLKLVCLNMRVLLVSMRELLKWPCLLTEHKALNKFNQLYLTGPPIITNSGKIIVNKGTNFTIACDVMAHPPANVSWVYPVSSMCAHTCAFVK